MLVPALFGGGSFGNGGAMKAGPLGVWFAAESHSTPGSLMSPREPGSGAKVTVQDTVAFCLWSAAARLTDYCAVMLTARVGGDVDTTCAIVGSIVVLATGPKGIPDERRQRREELKW